MIMNEHINDVEQAHTEAIAEDELRTRTGLVADMPCCGNRAGGVHHTNCQAIEDTHVRAFLEGITQTYYATGSDHSYAMCRARLLYRLAIRPHSTLSSLRAEYHDYVLALDSDEANNEYDYDYEYSVAMRAACDLFAEEIERTMYLRAVHDHRRWAIAHGDGSALLDSMIAEFGLMEAQRRLRKTSTQSHIAGLALTELSRRAKATLPHTQPSVCTCGVARVNPGEGFGHTAGCLHRDANRQAGL